MYKCAVVLQKCVFEKGAKGFNCKVQTGIYFGANVSKEKAQMGHAERKTNTYDVGNPGPGVGQAQQMWWG